MDEEGKTDTVQSPPVGKLLRTPGRDAVDVVDAGTRWMRRMWGCDGHGGRGRGGGPMDVADAMNVVDVGRWERGICHIQVT